jgi:hypothetical protein
MKSVIELKLSLSTVTYYQVLALTRPPYPKRPNFINPSPMSKPFGVTLEGRQSAHCLDNTGPKVYQVIEFDFGPAHEHAAILYHLGTKLPLILMVYSGGKSMHGWFNVRTTPDSILADFFHEAVSLGADPKMWSKSQFSRMPCGTNHKHKRQQNVVLFNPAHI